MKPVTAIRFLPFVLSLSLLACGGSGSDDTDSGVISGDGVSATNTAPVFSSFSATPANPQIGGSTLYEWTIADDDLTTLSCEIDVDSDGVVEYSLTECPATGDMSHTFDEAGVFDGSITVTDAAGLVATALTVVAVSPVRGDVPVIDSLSFTDTPVVAGTPVTINWALDIADGVATSCELDADGDGVSEYTFDPCPITGTQLHTYNTCLLYTSPSPRD